MSLCQIIAIVCILFVVCITGTAIFQTADAHPSKVKHVKYYDVVVCCSVHKIVVTKTYQSTSYYILEAHEEDPLHTSGSCSINHDVKLIIKEVWVVTEYLFHHINCPIQMI